MHAVTLLGGYASDSARRIGERYDLRFLDDRITVYAGWLPRVVMEITYCDIEAVDIGGPGLVKSGGGFAGGGFGAVGALEGMAIATVLNVLTTRTTITTIIRIQAPAAELFVLYTSQTPDQLRMRLSQPLGAIRASRAALAQPSAPASPVEELAKLAAMLGSGLLTREEAPALDERGRGTSGGNLRWRSTVQPCRSCIELSARSRCPRLRELQARGRGGSHGSLRGARVG